MAKKSPWAIRRRQEVKLKKIQSNYDNKKLIILHLSDLHFGSFNRHTGEIPFLQKIWEEIKKKIENNNIEVKNEK